MPERNRFQLAADRMLAGALFGLTGAIGRLPIDRSLSLAHGIGVRIGPLTPRHRIVLDNLSRALPELSAQRRAEIGREMWGHQARLIVESAFPEALLEFGTPGDEKRIEIDDRIGVENIKDGGPYLVVTAHMGCFEFLPAFAKGAGIKVTSLFRRPNNPFIAARLIEQRERIGGRLIRAHKGAARALFGELRAGRNVGLLVDQKFRAGPQIDFFGRPAPTNPLITRLARMVDDRIIGARCIRLPRNRYRITIDWFPRLPRDPDGRVDERPALLLVNRTVESWVRDHPEQWMWFHRRWQT